MWCRHVVLLLKIPRQFDISAHTARRPLRHDFNRLHSAQLRAPPTRSWCPLTFAPHCLLNINMRQADIFASWGTHMNLGNPIEVVPFRATTGLCGGAIHCPTVPCRTATERKRLVKASICVPLFLIFALSIFRKFPFSLFVSFEFFILDFRAFSRGRMRVGPHCVAGADPCERAPPTKPAWRA
jgi:hypothetical protein